MSQFDSIVYIVYGACIWCCCYCCSTVAAAAADAKSPARDQCRCVSAILYECGLRVCVLISVRSVRIRNPYKHKIRMCRQTTAHHSTHTIVYIGWLCSVLRYVSVLVCPNPHTNTHARSVARVFMLVHTQSSCL